jgi:hypothetical protein
MGIFDKYEFKKQPDVIQIETNILCNAKCDFCTQKQITRRPYQMEERIYKKIIDESRGLSITYRPFMLNEPFTDKRMTDICKYIKQDNTAKIEFNSNAGVLTKEITDAILDIGVDYMRLSIDGFYKDKYEERRKGIVFETAVQNAEYFCKRAKKYDTETEVRMIAFPDTGEEQKLFINKWSAIADKASITTLYRYPWEGQEEVVHKPCLKIRKEMFFYVDGRATLCCWDTAERAVIGDIKEQTVLQIWNGDLADKYRTLLAKGARDKIELCSRCDAYKDMK